MAKRNHNERDDITLTAVDELAHQAQEVERLSAELEQAQATLQQTQEALEAMESEMASVQDQLMRRAAEFQNFRRRTEQERGQLMAMGKSTVLQHMLDVLDDFERSLAAAEQLEGKKKGDVKAYKTLKQGVDLVYRKFTDALRQLGVEPIEAVGQPFDEQMHEAMMQQPAPDDTPPGTVVMELQKGYRMGERVIRHAKVGVAS